jgi:hypothetical protein
METQAWLRGKKIVDHGRADSVMRRERSMALRYDTRYRSRTVRYVDLGGARLAAPGGGCDEGPIANHQSSPNI